MSYHIVKSTRLYDNYGYDGPTCDTAGIEPGKTYSDEIDAVTDAKMLARWNPVGFSVVDAVSGVYLYTANGGNNG